MLIRLAAAAAVAASVAAAVETVVVAVAIVVAFVGLTLLIDYVVMIVANFAPNLAIHSMERIHYVKLEMAAGIVVVIENNSFGLSLLDAHFS